MGGCCVAVIDAYSRRMVGWSIADPLRSEPVVDALEMEPGTWNLEPSCVRTAEPNTRLGFSGTGYAKPGLLGAMGKVASSVEDALMESFWSTVQRELLDRCNWDTRTEGAGAIFEWIAAWYNPKRRHSSLNHHSPAEHEALHTKATNTA